VFDFRPAGRKLRLDFPKLTSRQAILDAILPLIGPLDTSHTASNLQIEISDDSATLSAYLMSQHFMPREGSRRGAENELLMNRYDCELVRDGQKWRFKRITIDNAWCQGDPEIVNGMRDSMKQSSIGCMRRFGRRELKVFAGIFCAVFVTIT